MSKGPGRIQRAVAAIFVAEPDNAFLTIELCERIYPDRIDRYCEGPIDNRFRIALMRAAKKVPGVEWQECSRLGGGVVFFNAYSVMSRGMADQKSNYGSNYRNRDRRICWSRTEEQLRVKLLGDNRRMIEEGSGNWFATEIAKARAYGDHVAAAELDARWQARIDTVSAPLKKIVK